MKPYEAIAKQIEAELVTARDSVLPITMDELIRRAFEALDAAGYAIVPKVPTEAMIKAGDDFAGGTWERMIETAKRDLTGTVE